MPTLPQSEKQEADLATISFQCPEQWKREVAKAAIDRGESMREICIRAISKHLKLGLPDELNSAA